MSDQQINLKKKKIGLLGGTFDPIHFAHLHLATSLKEKKGLDEVWFIPANLNPFKQMIVPAATEHRLAMLELALKNYPGFKMNEIELQRDAPSYTVDTIRLILEAEAQNPVPCEFFWLMGEDGLASFERWHEAVEIVRLIPLLIGSRFCELGQQCKIENPLIQAAVTKGLTKIPLMDISSTDLRQRLSKSLNCHHLIPAEVLSYIRQHQLYTRNSSK